MRQRENGTMNFDRYMCLGEGGRFDLIDLQRDNVDDLQESHISERVKVAVALLCFYFIFRNFAATSEIFF